MKLAEFVEQSLTEILKGIRAAQKTDGGMAVGAEMAGVPPTQSLLVDGGTYGVFTVVEFDVSVVAETATGGRAGLRVWSAGIEGEGKRSDHQTNRIKFAVQVKIPEGDKGQSP